MTKYFFGESKLFVFPHCGKTIISLSPKKYFVKLTSFALLKQKLVKNWFHELFFQWKWISRFPFYLFFLDPLVKYLTRVSDSNRNSWKSNIEYYFIKYSNSSNIWRISRNDPYFYDFKYIIGTRVGILFQPQVICF